MREAKLQVKKLNKQIAELMARFRVFHIHRGINDMFKICKAFATRRIVRERWNQWCANVKLDYVSRRDKMKMVPKIINGLLNRVVWEGFKKWKSVANESARADLQTRYR